ncbi:MAG: hypothetical protein AAGK17_01945 [Pseudomonadota bacterium]
MIWFLGIPLALIAAAFLYWQLKYPTYSYRYKLTVEIDTPEGVRSGYAVREVTWRDGPRITMEAPAGTMKERGEAVAVDLPNGQTLFALLYSKNQGVTARLAFGTSRLKPPYDRGAVDVIIPKRKNPVWGQNGYPRLVTFRDLEDPQSVERLDPSSLSELLGEGYELRRVTAELTDEAITKNVEKMLLASGWEAGRPLDLTRGGSSNLTLAQQLSYRDFSRGVIE